MLSDYAKSWLAHNGLPVDFIPAAEALVKTQLEALAAIYQRGQGDMYNAIRKEEWR